MPLLLLLLFVAHVGIALVTSAHVLVNYRRPTAAVAWLFALWFVPLVAAVGYLLFAVYEGPRRIRERRHRVAAQLRRARVPLADGDEYEDRLGDRRLGRIMQKLGTFPLTGGHAIDIVRSGDESYERMIRAIERAEREILLQTFILKQGEICRRLVDVASERARAGVDVRFLIDPIGSRALPRDVKRRIEESGIRMAHFLDPNPLKGRFQINFRNHRKNLVVDGAVAFTGGRNWGDDYCESAGSAVTFRDVVFEVRGPTVLALRRLFSEDWAIATDEPPPPSDDRRLEAAGDLLVRLVPHGPDEATNVLLTVLDAAIGSAQEEVVLVTPYFVPGAEMIQALRVAALGGARVRLLLPHRSDARIADHAARYYFDDLLAAGVEIHVCRDWLLHAKALVIDRAWSLVGSANFDQRSFHLNYELGLEVVGRTFADALVRSFDAEFEDSERVDAARFARRPRRARLLEKGSALLEPLL